MPDPTFAQMCEMLSDELADLGAMEVTPEMVGDALASTGLMLAHEPGKSTLAFYTEMMGGDE